MFENFTCLSFFVTDSNSQHKDDINGRQPQWKMTTLACLTSQFCSELGPAQPQLFFKYC